MGTGEIGMEGQVVIPITSISPIHDGGEGASIIMTDRTDVDRWLHTKLRG